MEYSKKQVLNLISHIHTKSAELTNKKLASKGSFVSSHGFILFLLSDGKKHTIGNITERINRTKSTTTALIKKLVQEGLVQIEANKNDNRSKLIFLTEKGMKYKKFTDSVSKELMDSCWKGFSENEQEELMRLLSKLSDNLK